MCSTKDNIDKLEFDPNSWVANFTCSCEIFFVLCATLYVKYAVNALYLFSVKKEYLGKKFFVNINYITFFLVLILVSACRDDILNMESQQAFTEDFIYDEVEQLERLVFTNYNSTERWGMNQSQWWGRRFNIEGGSFEAKFNFRDFDLFRLRGGWTPSNVGIFQQKWSNYWRYVRDINAFLDRVDDSGAMRNDPERTMELKAEMRFLRANLYTKLIKFAVLI